MPIENDLVLDPKEENASRDEARARFLERVRHAGTLPHGVLACGPLELEEGAEDPEPKEDLNAYKEKVLHVLHTRLAKELAEYDTATGIWVARHAQGINVCHALIDEIEKL